MSRKIGQKNESKYVTAEQKNQHFKSMVEKSVSIIDRQLMKIRKTAKGRSYFYSNDEVEKLNSYLIMQVTKTLDTLQNKTKTEETFAFDGE